MAQTVGDFLVERLHQWGVRILFGYPGDGINGVFGALNRADNWEQRVMEGDPKFNASQDIPDVPYHRFAELIGLKGIYVDNPDALGAAWDEALAADRPVVLEVRTDPEVPPLPPHITLQQAKNFAHAMVKGDPNERGMIVGAAR